MDKWSPQYAMNAYLRTLHLCQSSGYESTKTMEPKCMEFISALAAGKRAKLMVEVTTQGITPLTIALAVAAKQAGGRLICIRPPQHHHNFEKTTSRSGHQLRDLQDVIEYVHGNPLQLVKEFKNVDLLVMDGRLEDQIKLLKVVDFKEHGCDIVGYNMHYRRNDMISYGEVLKGKKGVGYKTMPIGDGIELTRIAPMISKIKRFKRFHVTFENY